MTLTELLSLNDSLTITLLEEAYHAVIGKFRLNPTAFPVVVTEAARVGGFDNLAYLLNDSEVAIKEITTLEGVTLASEFNDQYTPTTLLIGDRTADTDFGLTSFDDMNEEFATTPDVFWKQGDLILTNLDEAFFWIIAAAYPYFVTVVDSDPYTDEHRYDLSWMSDTYDNDNLVVDPVLVYPVALQAMAIHRQGNGDIVTASTIENFVNWLIELHNYTPESLRADSEVGLAEIEAIDI